MEYFSTLVTVIDYVAFFLYYVLTLSAIKRESAVGYIVNN